MNYDGWKPDRIIVVRVDTRTLGPPEAYGPDKITEITSPGGPGPHIVDLEFKCDGFIVNTGGGMALCRNFAGRAELVVAFSEGTWLTAFHKENISYPMLAV